MDHSLQEQTLRRALAHAESFLLGLDNRPIASTADLETLRQGLAGPPPEFGLKPTEVIDDLASAIQGGLVGCAGGRFYAWVIGGALPSALAADWLTTTWDQNAALYATGPAVSVIEEVAGEWLKVYLDLPREASFAFTSGCQMAHFTSLAAARHSVLQARGWDVNSDGLCGAPLVRLLVNPNRHHSIDRAARFLGFGSKSMEYLELDDDERVRATSLQSLLMTSEQPTIVVLNAADLNIGAFDPFDELVPVVKAAGGWVHVDGAFGLMARASARHREKTRGIELADSWATDAHKWLNVPFDCGMAFIRDREAHRQAMTVSASYIAAEGEARDQIDWNPEWSRKARGVPVYAALMQLGRRGLESLIDRSCQHCHDLVMGIGELEHAKVVWEPTLNQGLTRFLHPMGDAGEGEHDWMTERVIRLTNESGEAFFSSTVWKGRKAMRVSIVNWRTSEADIKRSIEAVQTAIQSVMAEQVGGGDG